MNIVYATRVFPHKKKDWETQEFAPPEMNIEGVGIVKDWFAHAEYNRSREQYEAKTIDGEHLFVNHHVKVTKSGLDGIKHEAWKSVSEKYPDILSKCTAVDLIDKQSCQRAKEVFSESVENKMLEMGYLAEAKHARMIRRWYEAEDEPCLSATERCKRWLETKEYLLEGVER